MEEEIEGLSDKFLDALIERDSNQALLPWPPLNDNAVYSVCSTLDDLQAISLVFLLTRDVEQVRFGRKIF